MTIDNEQIPVCMSQAVTVSFSSIHKFAAFMSKGDPILSLNRSCAVLMLLLLSVTAAAQQPATGFSRDVLSPLEKKLNQKGVSEHQGIQPFARGLEAGYYLSPDSAVVSDSAKQSLCFGVFGTLAGGYQLKDKSRPVANMALGLDGSWNGNPRWTANLGYSLITSSPPVYLQEIADSLHIIPGAGYAVKDDEGIYHNHYAYGKLAYTNGKFFHFEIGKGKHFWGDGYRSMILSDNAAPYPYMRITTKFWKVKYTNLWTRMKDLSHGQLFRDARVKYSAMHALSFNAGRKLNFSIYEMVVWQDRDTNNQRTLDISYLNPIIFYRPVEFGIGSPDNVILAFSMRWKPKARVQVYGQFILDEFNLGKYKSGAQWWGNKLGGQAGIKLFDIFIPGLNLQTELNIARPFLYTHGSTIQSWTHINQPLAHPMGNNFIESVTFLRYDFQKWKFSEQFTWAAFGRDRDVNGDGIAENLGGNIFRSYRNPYGQYQHGITQGLKSTFHYHEFTVSRKLFAADSYEAFVSHIIRFEKNEFRTTTDHFFMAGIRATGLLRPANDF